MNVVCTPSPTAGDRAAWRWHVLVDERLDAPARLVALVLAELTNAEPGGVTTEGAGAISRLSGLSLSSVKAKLKLLVALGYVVRHPGPNGFHIGRSLGVPTRDGHSPSDSC